MDNLEQAGHKLTIRKLSEKQKTTPAKVGLNVNGIPWWVWIGAIDLVFILLTTLMPYLPDSIRYSGPQHFDLARENNLATWWSTLTLLIPAFLALEISQNQSKKVRAGWLLLSLLLAVLSLDEIGSIHERNAWFASPLPYYTAIAMLMLLSLGFLWLRTETRRFSYWLALSFLLMFSVAMQEKIEHLVRFPEWFMGIRAGLEEGTELVGQFLIIAGLIPWLRRGSVNHSLPVALPRPLSIHGLQLLLLGGLAVHLALSYRVAIGYEVSNLGNPAMWYPMTVFFLLFCLAVWQLWAQNREKPNIWALLAVLFLANSVAAVYILSPRPGGSHVYSFGILSSFYFFTLLQVLLFYFLTSKLSRISKQSFYGLILLVTLLVTGYFLQQHFFQFMLGGIFAFVISNLFLSVRGQHEKTFV